MRIKIFKKIVFINIRKKIFKIKIWLKKLIIKKHKEIRNKII
jgi:hypothetical protein